MALNPDALKPVGYDHIPPNAAGEIRALARIGYSLHEAIADIIDNSVDANASNVLVRFFHTPSAITSIVIADDGTGMAEATLKRAMQIGAQTRHRESDLGLYGMGMKTASFSQCSRMSVVTVADGEVAGRSWSDAEIRRGWQCARLGQEGCRTVLAQGWAPLHITTHGTLIIWDEIRNAYEGKNGAIAYLRGLLQRVGMHIGICFHRMIKAGRIAITLDAMSVGDSRVTLQHQVKAIDPFDYPESGDSHYPCDFVFDLGGLGKLKGRAHVWPPRSKAVEYKLGGEAAARQGFYFYRNDRLIQAGGWNTVRGGAAEPHLSLARVQIDLPPSLDAEFSLTTQKSGVEVPDVFGEAVLRSRSGNLTWADYIKDANSAYRRRPPEPRAPALVPGAGLPRAVKSRARSMVGGKRNRAVPVDYRWTRLERDKLFDLDRTEKTILLNTAYRSALPDGPGLALFRTSLFLLLEEELRMEREMRAHAEWLSRCNQLLIAALGS